MALLYLEDQLGASQGLTAPELLVTIHWPGFRAHSELPAGIAAGPALTPIVNRGRWVVRCPFCPSANRASRQDPRFFCCECGNAQAGGKWLPVNWPDETDQIEEALTPRTPANRNWLPGETVDSLLAETEALTGGVEL